MPQLLFVWILLCTAFCSNDKCYHSKAAASATCNQQTSFVVASTRTHNFEQSEPTALHQHPGEAPLSRSSIYCTTSTSPSSPRGRDDGIVALQALLESSEWEACSLPTLRQQMGSVPRSKFCTTREAFAVSMGARIDAKSEEVQVPAWEKCAMAGQRSQSQHSPQSQWIGKQPQKTDEGQEATRRCSAALCCPYFATTMERIVRPSSPRR